MADVQFVLTTSGFILPKSHYYSKVQESNQVEDLIFNRILTGTDSANLKDYFVENDIYSSSLANEILNNYMKKDTFETYMAIVDSTIEILKSVDLKMFFKIQANNPHLSTTSFNYCLALLDGVVTSGKTQLNYFTVPYGVRFNVNKAEFNIESRQRKLTTSLDSSYYKSMSILIKDLVLNKTAMVAFYRYLFTDNYES
jgi:hypothetical protein